MIVPRLILGTARIAGGIGAGEAIGMVKRAFDAGIGAVDTAPSYGLGTAEEVVGKALTGHPQVEVTTKLGSLRPSYPLLRTLVRRLKRLTGPARDTEPSLPPQRIAQPTGNDFTAAFMAQSLAVSLERLGRIDGLLLHDITSDEATPEVLAELARLAGTRISGYASLAQWDPDLECSFASGQVAQCAPDPAWLLGTAAPPARDLRLHSLAKTGLALARQDAGFARDLDRAAAMIAADPATARIAAIYALAEVRIPRARLLFTSSHRARLEALIPALQAIDDRQAAPGIAACFAAQEG